MSRVSSQSAGHQSDISLSDNGIRTRHIITREVLKGLLLSAATVLSKGREGMGLMKRGRERGLAVGLVVGVYA